MNSSKEEQASDAKKIFVLGALGAGKSTVLNILSA
jgi:ABC-type lipoprotein export system ATPase subunit